MEEPKTPDDEPPHLPTPVISDEDPGAGAMPGQGSPEPDSPEPEMPGEPEKPQDAPMNPRWVLIRDVLVFQGKLALDALRDVALAPVAIIAAVVGVFLKPANPGHYFYDLMRWGRRTDHFINLFSAGQDKSERDEFLSVDDLVESLEKVVVAEHEKGGMTTDTKAHIDKTLDKLDEELGRDRARLTRGIKRAAVSVRKEVRKVTGQISARRRGGPGAS